jgi:flavin-dependent dehydrogenase
MRQEQCVIIGGGISGLSACNALLDLGIKPLLFESENYPRHKVCGEFFSAHAQDILSQWGINFPITITQSRLYFGNSFTEFNLPQPTYGLSRFAIDDALVTRARSHGATIQENTNVKSMTEQNGEYHITLSTKEVVRAHSVIFATGRHSAFAQAHWRPFNAGKTPYVGIKMHYSDAKPSKRVDVFVYPDAYVGVSSVEDGKLNVACLAKTDAVLRAGNQNIFMKNLLESPQGASLSARLNEGKELFPSWISCGVPPFGMRKITQYPNTYYVGDARGALAPICGNGLGMAVTSGFMAAQYLAKNDWQGYLAAWNKTYASPLSWGGYAQRLAFNPLLGKTLLHLSRIFPALPQLFFSKTRSFQK